MASRDEDKAMAGLLRRSLARDTAAGDACPTPDILAAFFERSLDAAELARYELHFSQCTHCREQLAALVRAEETQKPEPQSARLWDWRVLAPVALALVVGAFLYLRVSHDFLRSVDTSRPVAMSQPPAESRADSPAYSTPPQPAASPAANSGKASPPPRPNYPLVAQNNENAPLRALDEKKALAMPLPSAKRDDQLRSGYPTNLNPGVVASTESQPAAPVAGSAGGIVQSPAAAPVMPSAEPGENSQVAERKREAAADAVSEAAPSAQEAGARKDKSAPLVAGNFAAREKSMTLAKAAAVPPGSLIKTPDSQVQYRIAGVGLIERTKDGGATWQGQLVNASAQLVAGAAPSVNTCWLVGRSGLILLTKDGRNWIKIPAPVESDLVGIAASDAESATVTASDGRRFSTEDTGTTWKLEK